MGKLIPKNVRLAAMRAYVAENKTLREVAGEFGINAESLRRWLGDKVRPRGGHLKGKPSNNPSIAIKASEKPVHKRIPGLAHSKINYRANQIWTSSEDEMLKDAILSNMTVKETTELLGRSAAAIYCRKCQLIDKGYIEDPSTKFVMPRERRKVVKPMSTPVESVMSTPEVVAEAHELVEVEKPVELKVSEPVKSTSNIDLSDLAKLVKEFGVNVTLNVTSEGMEVKMSN